jgi:hypothetical protein
MAGDSELEMMGSFSLPFSQFFLKKNSGKGNKSRKLFFFYATGPIQKRKIGIRKIQNFFFFIRNGRYYNNEGHQLPFVFMPKK